MEVFFITSGPGLTTHFLDSVHVIFSKVIFHFPLIKEGQLSVTGKSIGT